MSRKVSTAVALAALVSVSTVCALAGDVGIEVTTTTIAVSEGGTATFNVRLASQPFESVTVTLTVTDDTDIQVFPGTTAYAPEFWDEWRTITVSASEDDDVEDGVGTITLAGAGLTPQTVTATESDDDYTLTVIAGAGGSTSPSGSSVREGNPPATVKITATPDPGNALLDWTGDVPAGHETDNPLDLTMDADKTVTANFGTSGVQMVVSATALTVPEGANVTFTVHLSEQPAESKTIAITATGDADLSVDPTALTFTVGDWDQPQTAIVSGAEDDDTNNGTGTVRLASTGMTTHVIDTTEADDDFVLTVNASLGGSVSPSGTSVREGNPPELVEITATADEGFHFVDWTGDVPAGHETDSPLTVTMDANRTLQANFVGDTVQMVVTHETMAIPEGSSSTFNVRLSAPPAETVQVDVAVIGDADVTVWPSSLPFAPAFWDQWKTVTVTVFEDSDREDGVATIGLSATGLEPRTIAVTEQDDDFALIVSSSAGGTTDPTGAHVYEGNPPATVQITAIPNSGYEFTEWSGDVPEGIEESNPLPLTMNQDRTVAATFVEMGMELVLSTTELSAPEGRSAAFTVALSTPPGASRAASISLEGDGDLSVSPAALTFTPGNWNQPQSVMVSAAEDSDTEGGSGTVTIASPGVTSQTVSVTEADDDYVLTVESTVGGSTTPAGESIREGDPPEIVAVVATAAAGFQFSYWSGDVPAGHEQDNPVNITTDSDKTITANFAEPNLELLVSTTVVTVGEGRTVTFTVKLSAEPLVSKVVSLVVTGDEDLGVWPASFTIAPAFWDVWQTVTVSAQEDADAEDGVASILVQSPGLETKTVAATENDDDYSLTVTAGAGGTTDPTGTTGWEGSPPATVPITAIPDPGYDFVDWTGDVPPGHWTDNPLTVTMDADKAVMANFEPSSLEIVVSTTSLTVAEGEGASFTVRLSEAPPENMVVTTSVSGDSDLAASPSTMTFTATTWSLAQTVNVTGAEDGDVENGTGTVSLSNPRMLPKTVSVTEDDDDYTLTVNAGPHGTTDPSGSLIAEGNPPASVPVTATPDPDYSFLQWTGDVPAGHELDNPVTIVMSSDKTLTAAFIETGAQLIVSTGALTAPEGGEVTFTIRLSTVPEGAATVVLSVTGDGDVSVAPAILTFTTSNWSQPQAVKVNPAEDADVANGTATIAIQSTGMVPQAVVVTEDDDDFILTVSATAGGSASPPGTSVHEGDPPVTVPVTATPGIGFVFTNWTGDVPAGHETDNPLALTMDANKAVTANFAESAVQLAVSTTSLTVPEGGSGTFTAVLLAEPEADITVAVTSTKDVDLVARPTALFFTSANWSQRQTVTVSAAEDSDASDGTGTVTLSSPQLSSKTVSLQEADDDFMLTVNAGEGGSTSPSGTSIREGSPPATVQIAATPNSGLVFVGWTGDVPSGHETDNPLTLTVDADKTVTATFAPLTVGLVVSTTALTVPEGGTANLDIKLSAQPTENKTVNLTATGDGDIVVGPATLLFTPINWDLWQTVSLGAAEDGDALDSTTTVAVSSPGMLGRTVVATEADDDFVLTANAAEGGATTPSGTSAHEGSPPETVPVTATPASGYVFQNWSGDVPTGLEGSNPLSLTMDRDRTITANFTALDIMIVLSPSSVAVPEGGTATFQVKLSTQPPADLGVTVTASGDSDLSAGPAQMTFTTTTWAQWQTVTVTALEDDDTTDGVGTMTLSSPGLATRTLSVSEEDDDFTLAVEADLGGSTSPSGSSVHEGEPPEAVLVRANPDPGHVFSHWTGDVPLGHELDNPLTLTMDQDRTVTAHFATSTLQLVLSTTTQEVPEGGHSTYSVRLSAPPSENKTVTISPIGDGDITSWPSSVTFTPDNWDVWRTVTLHDFEDDDAEAGTTVLFHDTPGLARKSVVATERDDDYTLLVDAGPGGTTNPSGASIREGNPPSLVEALAIPDGTHLFSHWTGEVPVGHDTDNPLQLTMDRERTVLANFVVLTLQIEVSARSAIVPEGGNAAFDVRLTMQPEQTKTISLSGSGDVDLTFSPAALTFTPSNWNQWRSVALGAGEDADVEDGTLIITLLSAGMDVKTMSVTEADDDYTLTVLTAPGGTTDPTGLSVREGNPPATVMVTATPDTGYAFVDWTGDVPEGHETDNPLELSMTSNKVIRPSFRDARVDLVLSATALSMVEGSQATFTAQFSVLPITTKTISIVTSGDPDVSVAPSSLVFTTGNWSVPQTVIVSTVEDADVTDGLATITLSGTDVAAQSVAVTEDDDDFILTVNAGPGGSTTPTGSSIREGNPPSVVTVTATSDPGYKFAGWTGDVPAGHETDSPLLLTMTANRTVAASFTATPVRLVLSTATLTLPEGASDTFTIQLSAAPEATLEVSVTSSGDPDITAAPLSLSFTPVDWSAPQAVTVAALEDDDVDSGLATITAQALGLSPGVVTATEVDDDYTLTVAAGPGGTTTPFGTSIREGSPPETVLVNAIANSGFTFAGWTGNVPAGDEADNPLALVMDSNRAVTAAFEEIAVDLLVSETAITVPEGGSATFTVQLTAPPSTALLAVLRVIGDGDLTASPSTLIFTDTTWGTPHTVTVSGAEDADVTHGLAAVTISIADLTTRTVIATEQDDDFTLTVVGGAGGTTDPEGSTVREGAPPEIVTIAATAQAGYEFVEWSGDVPPGHEQDNPVALIMDRDKTVTVHFGATGRHLVVSAAALTIPEGESATFAATLSMPPDATVVASVTVTGDPDLSASPASLTFTAANWSAPQIVTVSAALDLDTEAGTATVRLTAPGVGPATVIVLEQDAGGMPTADAGGPYETDEGATVTLSGLGSSDPGGAIVLYEWDLDNDGEFDDAQGATVGFSMTDDGAYPVSLRVTDDDGNADTDASVVTVHNVAPVATFTWEASRLSVAFTDTSSDPGEDLIAWAWDFGDGATATDQHPTHRYSTSITYTVTLTVTDDDGATDSVSSEVAASILFPETAAYNVAEGPFAIAAAKLDNGSKTDLAVACSYDNVVAVILGPTKAPLSIGLYPVGSQPVAIVCADFDKDGDPDVATANRLSNNVSVLLNNGNGILGTHVTYSVESRPQGLVAARLDGDKYPDLAVTNRESGTVSVLLNRGDGTFDGQRSYRAGAGPYGIIAADLDGDGETDLAAASSWSNQVSLLLNDGDGVFAPASSYWAGLGPYGLASADVDGDGDLDLATANYDAGTVSVLLNSGDVVFAPPVTYAAGDRPMAIIAADLDADGWQDLVATNDGGNSVSMFVNTGTGLLAPQVAQSVGVAPRGVVATHLDDDGYLDLATANFGDDTVSLLISDSEPVSLGSLGGTVTKEGADTPLKKVKVKLTNVQGGAGYMTKTDANGEYSIPDVLPGTYTVKVRKKRFRRASDMVTIGAGDHLTRDYQLKRKGG